MDEVLYSVFDPEGRLVDDLGVLLVTFARYWMDRVGEEAKAAESGGGGKK